MVIKGDQITQRSVVKPVKPYQLKRLSQEGITYYVGQGFGLGISLDCVVWRTIRGIKSYFI